MPSRLPSVLGAALLLAAGAASGSALTPADSGYVAVPGGRLHYDVHGAGFPLVLIHDGLACSAVWDAQVAAFAPDYRVVRYDRRGYGRSETGADPFSDVDDLHAVLEALSIERAVLVGSSAGGGLVLDYTLAHPERVEAIVLSGPVVNGLGYSHHFLARAYANTGADAASTIEKWVNDRYTIAPGNDAARARLRELLTAYPQNFQPGGGPSERQPNQAALRHLNEIAVPALLLVGDCDIPDVHAHVGAIEAGIHDARRVVIPNAGHLCCLEQPEAFDREVAEFLSLISLAPGSPRAAAAPVPPWDTFTRGFTPVADTFLYYEAMGAGDPIVLIHGGALDHRMWDAQFAALAAHHRVIRYDVRGHGLSLSPFGGYRSYEDLAALMYQLGIERADLVGLSMGCRIAADLAIAHPERVRSLVLASPGLSGAKFEAPEEKAFMQRMNEAWKTGDFAGAAEAFVSAWCDGPRRTPQETPPAVRAAVKAMALANVLPERDLGFGVELEPPAIDRLGEIRAPVVAILGESDMPGIHAIVERIGKDVPGARVERFPGVAHMVNLERPAEFDDIVEGFLRTRP